MYKDKKKRSVISVAWIKNYAANVAPEDSKVLMTMVDAWEKALHPTPRLGRRAKSVSEYEAFPGLYAEYMCRRVNKGEFAAKLGVSRPTLDKLIKEYKSSEQIFCFDKTKAETTAL